MPKDFVIMGLTGCITLVLLLGMWTTGLFAYRLISRYTANCGAYNASECENHCMCKIEAYGETKCIADNASQREPCKSYRRSETILASTLAIVVLLSIALCSCLLVSMANAQPATMAAAVVINGPTQDVAEV